MGRKRTGSAYRRGEAWWYAIHLRDGGRYAARVPPRPDGSAPTETQARAWALACQADYDAGQWTPEGREGIRLNPRV